MFRMRIYVTQYLFSRNTEKQLLQDMKSASPARGEETRDVLGAAGGTPAVQRIETTPPKHPPAPLKGGRLCRL